MEIRKLLHRSTMVIVMTLVTILLFGLTASADLPASVWPAENNVMYRPIPQEWGIDPYSDQLISDLESMMGNDQVRLALGDWTMSNYLINGSNYQLEDIYVSTGYCPIGQWINDVPFPTDQVVKCTPESDTDDNTDITDAAHGVEYSFWRIDHDGDGTWVRNSSGYYECENAGFVFTNSSGGNPMSCSLRGPSLSHTVGLIYPEELEAGLIDHGLMSAIPGPASLVIPPATKTDGDEFGNEEYPDRLPEIAVYRLKPSIWTDTAIENATHEDSTPWNYTEKVVAKAARDYGIWITDNSGTNHLYANCLYAYPGAEPCNANDPYESIEGTNCAYRNNSETYTRLWDVGFVCPDNFEVMDTIYEPYPKADRYLDYDGDGMLNAHETAFGYHDYGWYPQHNDASNGPLDWDNDGISNADECRLMSNFRNQTLNPLDPDTDGDGYTDYEEAYNWSADPTNSFVVPDPAWPGLPGGANFALGKTTSGSWGNGNLAVDGDDDTEAVEGSSTGDLIVDLGSVQTIGRVIVKWAKYGNYYARGFDIDVSNDGNNWTTINTITRGDGGLDDTWNWTGDARYVRVNAFQEGTPWGMNIREFEVYGPSGPQPPVANFSGNPTSGTEPLGVMFTDLSSNSPTSWDWTFGDGSTSTAQNPSHDYSAGTYTVSLEANNAEGSDTETKNNYISVSAGQPPVADFSGSPTTGNAPLDVDFTDASSNSPTSWSWTFGDGSTSTAQNPSHTYASQGDYTVALEATNQYGSDTETKTDYISVTQGQPPVADFVGNPTSGSAPLSVSFTDQSTNSPTSWSWTFGDGSTSTAQNPSHDYAVGTYTVALEATNQYGSDTETKTDYISASAGGTETIFSDDFETEFTGWNPISYASWYTGDPKNGTHSVHLAKDASIDRTISTVGYQNINVSFYLGAEGLDEDGAENAQALWYDGTDWTVLKQINWNDPENDNQLHYFEYSLPAGANDNANFGLMFKINADSKNKDHAYVDDVLVEGDTGGPMPPVADFIGSPTSGEAPLTVNFTDQSSNSPTAWSWTFGDGGSSTAQNPSHDYAAGTYTVSLEATNAAGSDTETRTDYISVSEPPQPPVADFVGNPTSGTAPLTVNFTDQSSNSPTSWDWTFGDGGSSTAQNPSHDYAAGTYTVSLEATNAGGSDTETKTDYITAMVAAPVADFVGNPTSGNAPLTVNFTDQSSNSPTAWSWTFGDGNTSTAQNPSHDYAAGTYTVSLEATNAGGSDTETKTDYIDVTTGQPPVADFSGSPTQGAAPLDVNFTDASTNSPTAWSWTFGDGNTSTAQHPSHQYAAGTYTVSLEATNAYGSDTETKTDYIDAGNAPVADFSGSPTSGEAPLDVNFTDASTNSPTAWDWTFGDGSTSSAQNPSHQYAAGTYTVSLEATNVYGSDTETKTDYISASGGGGGDFTPSSYNIVVGTYQSGGLSDIQSSNDTYLVVSSAKLTGKQSTETEYTFNTGLSSLSSLSVTHEWHISITSEERQRTLLWNYSTSGWEEVDNQVLNMSGTDTTVVVNVPSPANYISGGEVRVTLRCGDHTSSTFDQSIDIVKITASE